MAMHANIVAFGDKPGFNGIAPIPRGSVSQLPIAPAPDPLRDRDLQREWQFRPDQAASTLERDWIASTKCHGASIRFSSSWGTGWLSR